MELIDLYTREVGRNLPEKTRADIEKEIRSLIEDSLEDESEKSGRKADETMQVEVLKRLGPPEKIAASYQPPRYLIGPELFPHFLTTMRMVLSIVTVVSAVLIGISLAGEQGASRNIVDILVTVFAGFMDAIINAAGVVVLIFAIIQFTSPNFKSELKEKEWDPRQLLTEPEAERISVPGTIADVVATFFFLVFLNLYPQWIGIGSYDEGVIIHAPILTATFFSYLPWLNLALILEVLIKLWLMALGKWTLLHRWLMVGLSVLKVALLAWMLSGPAILALQMADITRLGWNMSPETLQQLNFGLAFSARLGIGITMAFQVVELAKQVYTLFRHRLPGALIINK